MPAYGRWLLGFAATFMLVGCSSKGELRVQRGLESRIDHGATASLSVEPHEKMEKTEAVQRAVGHLRGELFGRLVSEGVFRQIVQPGDDARYEVQVHLIAATEVSQTSRILFGVLAGANELAVQVDVFDTSTSALVVSFTANGESASHPFSSENAMRDAIRETVDEIIIALNT